MIILDKNTCNLSQTKTLKKYVILHIVRKFIALALQLIYDQLNGLGLSKIITKKVKKLHNFLKLSFWGVLV